MNAYHQHLETIGHYTQLLFVYLLGAASALAVCCAHLANQERRSRNGAIDRLVTAHHRSSPSRR